MATQLDDAIIDFVENFGGRLEYDKAIFRSAVQDLAIAAGLDKRELPPAYHQMMALCDEPGPLPTYAVEAGIDNLVNQLYWDPGPLVKV
jgi:hypothetical protein